MGLPFSQRGKRALGNMHGFSGETQSLLDGHSGKEQNKLKSSVKKNYKDSNSIIIFLDMLHATVQKSN